MSERRRVPHAAAALALATIVACTAPIRTGEPKVVTALTILPYESHRECARLAPDDRLDYAFESTEPVAFDIRYSEGSATVAPITRESTRGDAGVLIAQLGRDYCLVWEAGGAGTLIDYRIRVRSPR